jgi:hypothetical protein
MGLSAHTTPFSSQPTHSRSRWFSILPYHRRDPALSSSASIDPARIDIDAAFGVHLSTFTCRQHRLDVRLLVITRRLSRARTSRQKIAPLYSDHEACYGFMISPSSEISLRARRRAQLAAHLAMPSPLHASSRPRRSSKPQYA